MSWQPIETAPRDGTVVDLWMTANNKNSGYRVTDCWWSTLCECWISPGGDFSPLASHWMPLPAPPEGGQE